MFSENKSSLKLPYYLITGGEGGIRTRDTELPYTRFPGVLLQPLGHLTAPKHPTVVVVWNGAHYIENLAQCKPLRKLFTKKPQAQCTNSTSSATFSPELPYKKQINIVFANTKFTKLPAHPSST